MMRKDFVAGDFCICLSEGGRISPLEQFVRKACEAGGGSLTVEIPRGSAPTDEMLAIRKTNADRIDLLFAAEDDLNAPIERYFQPDVRIAALRTLCIDGVRYPLDDDRDSLLALLSHFDGSVNVLLKTVCRAFKPLPGSGYDVVRFPDIDGWRNALGSLWNADERLVRQSVTELTDAWLEANAVFEVRMIPTPFCDGVMVSPRPPAIVLRRIGEARGRVTLASGAGSADELYRNFDLACVQLRACGIANAAVPTLNGWQTFSLRYRCKKV